VSGQCVHAIPERNDSWLSKLQSNAQIGILNSQIVTLLFQHQTQRKLVIYKPYSMLKLDNLTFGCSNTNIATGYLKALLYNHNNLAVGYLAEQVVVYSNVKA